MFKLLLATLSLLIFMGIGTSEDLKSAAGYPLSKLGDPALRAARNRRTAHWESRSHSNLNDDRTDDDRDRRHTRISYPTLVDESTLGIPGRIELSEKSSNEIDFTEKSDEDDLKTEQCFDLEKPVEIGFLNGPKRFFNYEKKIRNGFADSGKFNIVRCRRRIQSWNRQEPVYVEEPRWIVIDLHAENSEGGFINEEDPFYVARGKKSSRNSQISLLPDEDHSHNSRKKRNAYGEAFRRSLFDANNPMILRELRTELEPRDKNSDLLYILNEPFFISRGKKNGARTERYVWKNRYAKVLANFESKTDPYLPRASRTMVSSGSRAETLAHRDRRGVMEDLLKKNDPFYLARGKKSLIDVSEEFQNLLLSNSKAFKKSTEFARFSTEKENQ